MDSEIRILTSRRPIFKLPTPGRGIPEFFSRGLCESRKSNNLPISTRGIPMTEVEPALLEARDVTRRGGDGALLLDGVTLAIRAGERLALTGPTGSGKSLLLRSLALLDAIAGGEILWRGRPVAAAEIPAFRREAVYLQQRSPLMEGTVESNLQAPFQFRVNRDRRYERDRCVELLSGWNLGGAFLQKKTAELSGGESQIVAAVRALQLNPQLLLLDEPTAALDAASVERFERSIDGWLQRDPAQRSLLWVTHDAQQAARVAGKQFKINAGKLRQGGREVDS